MCSFCGGSLIGWVLENSHRLSSPYSEGRGSLGVSEHHHLFFFVHTYGIRSKYKEFSLLLVPFLVVP